MGFECVYCGEETDGGEGYIAAKYYESFRGSSVAAVHVECFEEALGTEVETPAWAEE